ncbi:MAG TPA: sulfatase, partial [Vicinamibacteria bacterium]|nr:sulfatase [Vicinamibacteria bacterium]
MHALAALLLTLAVPASAASRPRVVLVTLDTTRADRMGFLGAGRGLTPALDALARQAVVFERAYAAAPLTTVSHATILTGVSPGRHGVVDFGVSLPASVPYLPAILKAAGYRTAAFVGALVLDPRDGTAPGFDRGFDTYDAGFGARLAGQDRYRTLERRGRDVVARALRWLDAAGAGPVFLWVHLYDPHDPYEAEPPFSRMAGRSAYDAEIAATDAAVGTLLAGLRARPDWTDTLVAICADHGESLGDHGEDTHGVFLYDETVHVPLLVKRLREKSAGRRVAARVGLVDLVPTILEEIGIAAPPSLSGRSLWPILDAPRAEDRPACGETDYPSRSLGWSPLRSLRIDRFLFVDAPRRELYDQAADPGA